MSGVIYRDFKNKIPIEEFNILLSFVIQKPKEFILSHPDLNLSFLDKLKLKHFLKERAKGKPIAYIIKEKEFFGLNFFVNKNVLIPRPETEVLIKEVINCLKTQSLNKKTLILDVGTGSGNIIIAIFKALNKYENLLSQCCFKASDISKKALFVAKKNIKKYKLEKNIKVYQSDLLLNKKLYKKILKFDKLIICANLPYVPSDYLFKTKNINTIGLKYEPKNALDGGKDGLNFYRELIKQTKQLKKENSNLKITSFYEIENQQKEILDEILKNTIEKKYIKDLANNYRLCIAKY